MLDQYYRLNQAIGVSIQMLTQDSVQVNVCGVVRNKSKLDFKEKLTDIADVKNLKEKLPQKSNIALGLSGKGVLQKKIDRLDEITSGNFNQILPNANFDDFYVQNFVSDNKSFVSVIRKVDADRWIEIINDLGLKVYSLSLGAFAVKQIEQQLNVYGETLVFDGYCIDRNEQFDWLKYTYNETSSSPFSLKVETESIDEKLVLPYALAFQLILADNVTPITANADKLTLELAAVIDRRKLKVQGAVVLCVVFVLLLINFFVLSSITAANKQLTDKLSFSTINSSTLRELNDEVKTKQNLIKELGWDGGISKSVLIDDLAALLPPEVSWTEIVVNPTTKDVSSGLSVQKFEDRTIRITGKSDQILPVNEWVARIQAKKWVKSVELDNYSYDNELVTGRFTVIVDF